MIDKYNSSDSTPLSQTIDFPEMEDIEDEEIKCSIKMSDVNYTKIIEIIACKLVVDMARFYDQKPLNTTVITELVLSDGYGSS